MPTSFKTPIPIQVNVQTPEEDLEFCSECGGLNALTNTALDIECTVCDGTGYENLFQTYEIPAYYRPGFVRRWDKTLGNVVYDGDASIKLNERYRSLIERATHLEFNGAKWDFRMFRDPGKSMGQPRIILTVTRKE